MWIVHCEMERMRGRARWGRSMARASGLRIYVRELFVTPATVEGSTGRPK
jgi:hypothetical protein